MNRCEPYNEKLLSARNLVLLPPSSASSLLLQQFSCHVVSRHAKEIEIVKKGKILIDFWYLLLLLLPQQSSLFNNCDWCIVIMLCYDLFNIYLRHERSESEWVVRYEIEHERKIVVKRVSFRDSAIKIIFIRKFDNIISQVSSYHLKCTMICFEEKKNVLRKFLINKSFHYFCYCSTKCY